MLVTIFPEENRLNMSWIITDQDYITMDDRTDLAVKMIQAFTSMGIGRTMSDFNGK